MNFNGTKLSALESIQPKGAARATLAPTPRPAEAPIEVAAPKSNPFGALSEKLKAYVIALVLSE